MNNKCMYCGKELSNKYLVVTEIDSNSEMTCCNYECFEKLDLNECYVRFIDNDFNIADLINRYENEGLELEEMVAMFQFMYDNGLVPRQMGYQHTLEELIEYGYINID